VPPNATSPEGSTEGNILTCVHRHNLYYSAGLPPGWKAIHQVHLRQTRAPTRSQQQSADADSRQQKSGNMHSKFCKGLFAVAMIGAARRQRQDIARMMRRC